MNANLCVEQALDFHAAEVGKHLDAAPIAIVGPVLGSLDLKVRQAVESIPPDRKKAKAAIVLDTDGGVVELVERMVGILRHHFAELHFVIPDRAMSAGTIFALAGDAIWMDYFSCLGPIDPQIERDGKLVPALSYVVQFEQLVRKSWDELVRLVPAVDPAVIEQARQAAELFRRLGLLSTAPTEAVRPFTRRPAGDANPAGVSNWSAPAGIRFNRAG